jgi:hypothetical protein
LAGVFRDTVSLEYFSKIDTESFTITMTIVFNSDTKLNSDIYIKKGDAIILTSYYNLKPAEFTTTATLKPITSRPLDDKSKINELNFNDLSVHKKTKINKQRSSDKHYDKYKQRRW